jgi:protease IV
MPITTDTLLDRKRLKAQIRKWRALALIAIAVFILLQVGSADSIKVLTPDYIARIKINDIIAEDDERTEIIERIKKDKHIKAVIMHVDSPGGTVVGGEKLYNVLRELATTKPLVTVMGTVAASGGYMVALAADHVLAQYNSITGSVGVILQTAEVTELAKKMGIHFLTFKSGELKATPSPFENLTPAGRASIEESIQDSFSYFLNLVKERRKLTPADIQLISDGRIFTGNQAVKHHLVDAIGGEREARAWLTATKKISSSLEVKEIPLHKKKSVIEEYMKSFIGNNFITAKLFSLDGLLAIWHPI